MNLLDGPRILLSPEIERLVLEAPGSLVVRHKSYPELRVDGARHVLFDEFAASPRKMLAGISALVVVGITRCMTPSNRTKEVFEVLFNTTRSLRKVSIDCTLFVGDPWRAWFPFGLCGVTFGPYTYSYLVESHWKSFVDGVRNEDPVSLDEIQRFGVGDVWSDGVPFFEAVDIKTVEISADVKARYAAEKALAFDEETTLVGIVSRLAAVAKEAAPKRSIPSLDRLFRARRHAIVATDLPVDRYLIGEIEKRVALVNGTARVFA